MSDKFPGQSDAETEQKKVVDQSINPTDKALNPSRRKFTAAGVIAPVVLSVGARPAFANMCSISGGGSPGSNQEQPKDCLGCTPGYWKRNVHAWPVMVDAGIDGVDGAEPSEGSCSPMSPGKEDTSTCKVFFNDGTRFDDVFTGGQASLLSGVTMATVQIDSDGDVVEGTLEDGDYYVRVDASDVPVQGHIEISLMQVLWLDKSSAPVLVALAFHLAAAFLNALKFPFEYGYNAEEIIRLYDDAMMGEFPDGVSGLEGLKDVLDIMNNRGCPLSGNANPK